MTFRARLVPLPGSVMEDGGVIAFDLDYHAEGPCFIPEDLGCPGVQHRHARALAMNAAGWSIVPAAYWPAFPPTSGLKCIARRGALDVIRDQYRKPNRRRY